MLQDHLLSEVNKGFTVNVRLDFLNPLPFAVTLGPRLYVPSVPGKGHQVMQFLRYRPGMWLHLLFILVSTQERS